METSLLSLKRKHPKLFNFFYRDEWLRRYVRREVNKSREKIAKQKDSAWLQQDRDMYDLLTMLDEIYKTIIDL